jgi:aminopeptidase N
MAGPAFADASPGDGFHVVQYALGLTPDLDNKTVAGVETITLRSTVDNLRQLSFSGNALIIDHAKLDGADTTITRQGDRLVFGLGKKLVRGRNVKLELSYHGRPARGVVGSGTSLYTSYFACDWMVCLEEKTGDKALFSLDLRVPRGMETLSVGRMIGERPGPDGSEIFRWRTSRPYSAYLFGFAIGRYARVEDHVGGAKLVYLSDIADGAELERRFGETREMVRFLSDKAGVPLPTAQYTELLVSGDEAQEAATYSVIGEQALPKKAGDPAEDERRNRHLHDRSLERAPLWARRLRRRARHRPRPASEGASQGLRQAACMEWTLPDLGNPPGGPI